jgi:hypothetical protein
MGFWGFMIIPPVLNFQGNKGMEVKTTSESSESGTFGDFRGGNKIGVIVVAMLNQSDYFWLSNIIIL